MVRNHGKRLHLQTQTQERYVVQIHLHQITDPVPEVCVKVFLCQKLDNIHCILVWKIPERTAQIYEPRKLVQCANPGDPRKVNLTNINLDIKINSKQH